MTRHGPCKLTSQSFVFTVIIILQLYLYCFIKSTYEAIVWFFYETFACSRGPVWFASGSTYSHNVTCHLTCWWAHTFSPDQTSCLGTHPKYSLTNQHGLSISYAYGTCQELAYGLFTTAQKGKFWCSPFRRCESGEKEAQPQPVHTANTAWTQAFSARTSPSTQTWHVPPQVGSHFPAHVPELWKWHY